MEDQDQVTSDAETPVDETEALGGPDDTQGAEPVSSPSQDEATTAEPSEPSVDERIAKLEADNERAKQGYREMQSRAERAESRLRPFEEKEAAVIAERMTNDTAFQARCDEIGYAAAHAEVAAAAARQVLHEHDAAVQAQISREKDNEVYDKMREEWNKSGRPAAEFEPFLREQNGFVGISRKTAMKNFLVLLGGKEALAVSSKTQEANARRAEERAQRVAANQPAKGEAATGVAPVPAGPGDKLFADLEKAKAASLSDEAI